VLEIPPPVSKENADEYFEVLEKRESEKEAEKWIEKHSNEDRHYTIGNDSSDNIIQEIKPPPNLFGIFIVDLLLWGPIWIILGLNFILAIIVCAVFSVGVYVVSVNGYNKKIKNAELGIYSKNEKSWVKDVVVFSLSFIIILFLFFIWFVIWFIKNFKMSGL
tara:strand:- start:159 stop:644 length:486 start_codon:yes stop_codon:yes gene_type:complete